MKMLIIEMKISCHMCNILERQTFRDFYKNLISTAFIAYGKIELTKKVKKKIDNLWIALNEAINNIAEHVQPSEHDEYYCIIQVERDHEALYIICQDFGSGMTRNMWEVILEGDGGASMFNPKTGIVDHSELMDTPQGTRIKLTKYFDKDEK